MSKQINVIGIIEFTLKGKEVKRYSITRTGATLTEVKESILLEFFQNYPKAKVANETWI
ncbi:MAG: hypothetical protein HC819_14805 [Cyclobacteriaceae bacterium]|nr:hypothetical protein [Cyclobacteriaceae bacterium]